MNETTVSVAEVEDPFEFHLAGPGLEFKRNVSQTVALQLIAVAMGGANSIAVASNSRFSPPAPAASSGTGLQLGERVSLREFMDGVNARKIPEQILAIAYFLTSTAKKEMVTREEIRGSFKDAGEPAPANFPRDLNNTLSLGWIAFDPSDRDKFYITRKGTLALESKFELVDTAPPRRRRRGGTGGSGGEGEEAPEKIA